MTDPHDKAQLTPLEVETLAQAVLNRLGNQEGSPLYAILVRILDVPVTLRVELGKQTLSLSELLALGNGKILELNRSLEQPLDVCVGDRLLAQGRAVVVGGKFGVEIVQVAQPQPSSEDQASRVLAAGQGAATLQPEPLQPL